MIARLRTASALAAALLAAGCASGGGKRATARLQAFRYADSSGLTVTSDGVELEQPVGGGLTVRASGLVEEIVIPGGTTSGDAGGHDHDALAALAEAPPDVITTASSIASAGTPGQKRRVEGNVGVIASRRAGEIPVDVDVRLRTSEEADYASLSAAFRVAADLLDRNLTVALSAGYGADRIAPLVKPEGQEAQWPGRHERVNAGVAVTQLLSPELALSGGASVNYQYGLLANPYRRALVQTTLFAEAVPSARLRGTAFARLAWWLGAGTALHLRQGVYADDWGVRSLVPEVTLAKELGRSGLILARGRVYVQSAATFYRPAYAEVAPLMTGDVRLGRVRERLLGGELRWSFLGEPETPGALEAAASYDRSWISYPDAGVEATANVLSLALVGTF